MFGDTQVDVVSAAREKYMIKVVVRRRGKKGSTQTVWVTPDGRHATDSLYNVPLKIAQMERDRAFSDCAIKAGYKVYLHSGARTAAPVMRLLGHFGHRLVIDCARDMENCKNLGIKEFPTHVVGDKKHTGVKDIAWLETFMGCAKP